MSVRVDTSQLISGAVVVGDTGLGVLAENVPSTGEDGPGYLWNDLVFPADQGSEVMGTVVSWPTNGTLYVYEDSSFTYTGTSDIFTYQFKIDGVSIGSPATVTLNVGATHSYPAGIPPTTYFGIPTYSLSIVTQTSTPTGIDTSVLFGVPQAYLSTNLQTSSPSGIATEVGIGTPTYSFSGTQWVDEPDSDATWTDVTPTTTTWTEV